MSTPATAAAAGAPSGGRWSGCITRPSGAQQDRRLVVEPKTYFANERTFFHWMLPGTLLMVSSITLGGDEHHFLMIPLMVSSALLMMYALYVYYKRIHLISTRATSGYAEKFGPVAITMVLIACHVYSAGCKIWYSDKPVTAVQSSAFLSPEMQESHCPSWKVLMEPGLASSTSYRVILEQSKGLYVDVEADRGIVRRALEQLATEGLTRTNMKEMAWQERVRQLVKADSLNDSEMHIVQSLDGSSRVVWEARGSPKLPCGTAAELSLDVRCEGGSVSAVVQKPLRDESVWAGRVDLEQLFPGAGRQLPASPGFEADIVAIVEFGGLSIRNENVKVQLRSVAHHAEVTLLVPRNPQSDPELHAASRNVWLQLLENVHGPEHAQGCDAPFSSAVV